MRKVSSFNIIIIIVCIAIICAPAIGGCGRGSAGSNAKSAVQKTNKEIIIVNHTSLTGPFAEYGQAIKTSIAIAAKESGAFTVGTTEYRLKVVYLDDKGSTDTAVAIAQQAIDMGAAAVIGPLTYATASAALPVYAKANIPVISPSVTQADLTGRESSYFFRTCLGDDIQGQVLAQWAAELGYRKVSVLDDNSEYSKALADIVEATLESADISVDRQHTVDDKQTDFSDEARDIKRFDSKAVIFTGYHKQCGLLRKELNEAKLTDVRILGSDGIKSKAIFEAAGSAESMEGTLCTFALDRSKLPGFSGFAAKFKQTSLNKEPAPFTENAYDAFGVLVQAIKNTGGSELIEELYKIDYSGVLGEFGFDDDGNIEIPGAISKFIAQDGEWVPYKKAD